MVKPGDVPADFPFIQFGERKGYLNFNLKRKCDFNFMVRHSMFKECYMKAEQCQLFKTCDNKFLKS